MNGLFQSQIDNSVCSKCNENLIPYGHWRICRNCEPQFFETPEGYVLILKPDPFFIEHSRKLSAGMKINSEYKEKK